jgi:hypothetical protein
MRREAYGERSGPAHGAAVTIFDCSLQRIIVDARLRSRVVLRRGCASSRISDGTPSAPPRVALSSVNPLANKRDCPLIDRSSIPCLDSYEIGFAGLVSRGCAPAMGPEEICRRGPRVGRGVEISAGAVV